jgi:hypothetical protein
MCLLIEMCVCTVMSVTLLTHGLPAKTVYNRLRSKYSVKERETGVWLKPEIERYAGKSEEMLQPNAGTQHMMARALAGTPQLSDVNLPGLRQSKSRATTSKKGLAFPLVVPKLHGMP